MKKILILGAGGYVGGALVRELLRCSQPMHVVSVDSYWFSEPPTPANPATEVYVRDDMPDHRYHKIIVGDIRDPRIIEKAMKGVHTLIHLACISNDPGFDLNPALGKSINYDCLPMIVTSALSNYVENIIYASSSSVYGICEGEPATEDSPTNPLTDYAKYKMLSEEYLRSMMAAIPITILRPATLCGHTDTAMRFDLMLNSFVAQAYNRNQIEIRGGQQRRSLLNIRDMVWLYKRLALEENLERIAGKMWNVGYINPTIEKIAEMAAETVSNYQPVKLVYQETNDTRSYAIDSNRIWNEYFFRPIHLLALAIDSILYRFITDSYSHSFDSSAYIRVKRLKELEIS